MIRPIPPRGFDFDRHGVINPPELVDSTGEGRRQ